MARTFGYKIGPVQEKSQPLKLFTMPLDITISTKQKIQVTLAPKGADGKPFTLTSKPTWAVTAGIATLQVADDGLSAWLISSDSEGDSLFTVTDTTPGSILKDTVTLHSDVVTVPPPPVFATDLGLTAGTPVSKVP